jgi:hypothetical protein
VDDADAIPMGSEFCSCEAKDGYLNLLENYQEYVELMLENLGL